MTHIELSPGDRVGPYQVITLLSNKGGMGTVYLVSEASRPTYNMSLKIHLAENTPDNPNKDLLDNEVEILPKLRHPGIIRILPTYLGEKSYYALRHQSIAHQPWYFVMEYVTGGSLTDSMERIVKRFPLAWKVELFYQLACTIHYLHQCGYAHCDIKPDNILLRRKPHPNELPLPVLIDFGCAVSCQSGILRKAFTDRYVPPEVVQEADNALAEKRSPRHPKPSAIDIWMLGATLFEMLTLPKKEKTTIRAAMISDEVRRAREQNIEIPQELERLLIDKLLNRRPEERIDIENLIKDIEQRHSYLRPPRISSQSWLRRWMGL